MTQESIQKEKTGLMTEGLLEVLLVKAEGIQHKNHLGSPAYYVVAECGCLVRKSNVKSGKGDKVWWNEKLSYKFPIDEWKLSTHLNLKIMNSRFLGGGVCVGQSRIYLGGVVENGLERDLTSEVRPSTYNVVLEDNTYRGEVVVGLRFTTTDMMEDIEPDGNCDPTKPPSPLSSRINKWRIWWWELLFSFNKRIASDNKSFD